MNSYLTALFATPALFVASLHAADPAPAPAASRAEQAGAAQPDSAIRRELNALVEKIGKKLQSGERSKEALKGELAEFDALIDRHKENKSDEAAEAAIMRAMLYVEVLEDREKGTELFKQIKADYPQSRFAGEIDGVLAQMEQQKTMDQARAALKEGAEFPNFEATGLDGKPVSIAGLKGKVVLVDFWATWCGPCVQEMPHVIAAYEKYHDKGFEVVGISLDRDKKALEKFLKDRKITWAQVFDEKGELAEKYGVQAIPTTYLLGPDGKIVASKLTGDALETQLAKLLK